VSPSHPVRFGDRRPLDRAVLVLRLDELLVADALAATAKGDRAHALQALDAAWTLAQGFEDQPDLIHALMHVSCLRMVVGAVRQVGPPPETWDGRLRLAAARGRFLEQMAIGARQPFESGPDLADVMPSESAGPITRVSAARLSPLGRWYSVVWADEARRVQLAVRAAFPPCAADVASVQTATAACLDGRRESAIMAPNIVNAVARFERLVRDAVLTRAVLRADATRRATGAWPAGREAVSEDECAALAIVVEPAGRGVELALEPTGVADDDASGPVLPERFLLEP